MNKNLMDFRGYAVMKNADGVITYFGKNDGVYELEYLYSKECFKTRKSAFNKLAELEQKQPQFDFEVIEVII